MLYLQTNFSIYKYIYCTLNLNLNVQTNYLYIIYISMQNMVNIRDFYKQAGTTHCNVWSEL